MRALSVFVAAFLAIAAISFAKDRDWKVGTLLDSKSTKTYVQTGSSTQSDATANTSGSVDSAGGFNASTTASGSSQTQIHSLTIQDTQFVIVGDQYLFVVSDTVEKSHGRGLVGLVGNAVVNSKHGCRLIVNDPVKYFQDKSVMYVLDADGKECKMDLARQERIIKPVPADQKK
jgi:hypothetical protein